MHHSTRIPRRLIPLAAALVLGAAPAMLAAQSPSADPATSGPLYEELARQDSLLFDAAFVACDAAKEEQSQTEESRSCF